MIERDVDLIGRYRRLLLQRRNMHSDRINELETAAREYDTAVSLANGPVPARSIHWALKVEPAREKLRAAVETAERIVGK